MDLALVVITLLSLGLTGALLVYAARLQREQRERENARVAVLARELRLDSGELAGGQEAVSADAPALFAGDRASRRQAGRFTAPIVGVMVVGLVGSGMYFVSARTGSKPPATERHAPAAAPTGALELVTLEAQTGRRLTVRGVVRNPDGAAVRRGVSAVVFVFDRAGTFVASARAAIDAQVLEGGDESTFTVTVPNASHGSRYRVSFRAERDVLPHVDRRAVGSSTPTRLEAGAASTSEGA